MNLGTLAIVLLSTLGIVALIILIAMVISDRRKK
jgi:hypothetical protein